MPSSSNDPVELLLREHGALQAFNDLTSAGCDRVVLHSTLHMIHSDFPGFDSVKRLTGLDRKGLKAAIKRFRRVALEIQAINLEHFGLTLLPPSSFTSLGNLPTMLETYAKLLERRPLTLLGRVRNPVLHYQKFCLTRHVIESSHDNKPHDEEVAAIVDAVLPPGKRRNDKKSGTGQPKTYDAVAHKQWRFEYYEKLARLLESK